MRELEKYISQVLDLIYKKSEFDQILFDLSLFADKINYSTVLNSGSALDDKGKRKELVSANLCNIDSTILREYFHRLLDEDDLWVFDPAHFKVFVEELSERSQRTVFIKLTTALQLADHDLRGLSVKLSKKMDQKVVIDLVVDKNIIGGTIIRKDNYILDYSIKTKLSNLATQWKKTIQQSKDN
jgi:F-type H+-transporting ATPase subunit delta